MYKVYRPISNILRLNLHCKQKSKFVYHIGTIAGFPKNFHCVMKMEFKNFFIVNDVVNLIGIVLLY